MRIEGFDIYDRQKRLDSWDQDIIERSTVAIAGLGGIGTETFKSLVLLGFTRFLLIDHDVIRPVNYSRQFYVTDSDMELPKTSSAKKWALHFNPKLEITEYQGKIQNCPLDLLDEVDLILGCLDNNHSREYLNLISHGLGIPFIDAGSEGYHGHIQIVIPEATACFACLPEYYNVEYYIPPCDLNRTPRNWKDSFYRAFYRIKNELNEKPDPSSHEHIQFAFEHINDEVSQFGLAKPSLEEIKNFEWYQTSSSVITNTIVANYQVMASCMVLFTEKKFYELIFSDPLIEIHSWPQNVRTLTVDKRPDCETCSIKVTTISAKINQTFSEIIAYKSLRQDFHIFCFNQLIDQHVPIGQIFDSHTVLLDFYTDTEHSKILLNVEGDEL